MRSDNYSEQPIEPQDPLVYVGHSSIANRHLFRGEVNCRSTALPSGYKLTKGIGRTVFH